MSWYDDALVLRDFANALVEAEYIEDANVVLAKPYRFSSEFNAWKNAEYPGDEEDEGWTEFVNSLQTEEEEEEETET